METDKTVDTKSKSLVFLDKAGIEYKKDVLKSCLTGMKSNDILPVVAWPSSLAAFRELLEWINTNNLSYEVCGGLTNTYLAEGFKRDIIIKTTRLKGLINGNDNECVIVECGYSLTKLSCELSSQGIDGYSGLVGIPGTIGGAVVNNSGGFNSSIDNVVNRVLVFKNGQERWIENCEMGFATRCSTLKCDGNKSIVLAVEFDTSKKRLQAEIDSDLEKFAVFRRKWIDGKRKSLGSIFVASSLSELIQKHQVAFTAKRYFYAMLRIFVKNPYVGVWLDFFFLGRSSMAKHCDSLNRFCWDADTTEEDFYNYIRFMQDKADGKMNLEIQIKR